MAVIKKPYGLLLEKHIAQPVSIPNQVAIRYVGAPDYLEFSPEGEPYRPLGAGGGIRIVDLKTVTNFIPSGLTAEGIGSVTSPLLVDNNGTWTISGTHATGGIGFDPVTGLMSTSDTFVWVPMKVTGDWEFAIRLAARPDSTYHNSFGIVARESEAADSAFVATIVEANDNTILPVYRIARWRPATGATAEQAYDTTSPYPTYIRLKRTGSVFQFHVSTDGVNWAQIGSDLTLPLSTDMLLGVAVASARALPKVTAISDSENYTGYWFQIMPTHKFLAFRWPDLPVYSSDTLEANIVTSGTAAGGAGTVSGTPRRFAVFTEPTKVGDGPMVDGITLDGVARADIIGVQGRQMLFDNSWSLGWKYTTGKAAEVAQIYSDDRVYYGPFHSKAGNTDFGGIDLVFRSGTGNPTIQGTAIVGPKGTMVLTGPSGILTNFGQIKAHILGTTTYNFLGVGGGRAIALYADATANYGWLMGSTDHATVGFPITTSFYLQNVDWGRNQSGGPLYKTFLAADQYDTVTMPVNVTLGRSEPIVGSGNPPVTRTHIRGIFQLDGRGNDPSPPTRQEDTCITFDYTTERLRYYRWLTTPETPVFVNVPLYDGHRIGWITRAASWPDWWYYSAGDIYGWHYVAPSTPSRDPGGTFRVITHGLGFNVWSTYDPAQAGNVVLHDSGHFIYVPMSADGDVTFHVISRSGNHPQDGHAIGMMWRAGMEATDIFECVNVVGNANMAVQVNVRLPGGEGGFTTGTASTVNIWFRCSINQETVRLLWSNDGTNWVQARSTPRSEIPYTPLVGIWTHAGRNITWDAGAGDESYTQFNAEYYIDSATVPVNLDRANAVDANPFWFSRDVGGLVFKGEGVSMGVVTSRDAIDVRIDGTLAIVGEQQGYNVVRRALVFRGGNWQLTDDPYNSQMFVESQGELTIKGERQGITALRSQLVFRGQNWTLTDDAPADQIFVETAGGVVPAGAEGDVQFKAGTGLGAGRVNYAASSGLLQTGPINIVHSPSDASWPLHVYSTSSGTFKFLVAPDGNLAKIRGLDWGWPSVQRTQTDSEGMLMWRNAGAGVDVIFDIPYLRTQVNGTVATPIERSQGINFKAGTGVTLTWGFQGVTTMLNELTISSAGGGGVPVGNDGDIQFKAGAVFGFDSRLHYSSALNQLTAGNATIQQFVNGAFINLPTGGPSYVQIGGWIAAYARLAGDWITTAAAGDAVFQNGAGNFLFSSSTTRTLLALRPTFATLDTPLQITGRSIEGAQVGIDIDSVRKFEVAVTGDLSIIKGVRYSWPTSVPSTSPYVVLTASAGNPANLGWADGRIWHGYNNGLGFQYQVLNFVAGAGITITPVWTAVDTNFANRASQSITIAATGGGATAQWDDVNSVYSTPVATGGRSVHIKQNVNNTGSVTLRVESQASSSNNPFEVWNGPNTSTDRVFAVTMSGIVLTRSLQLKPTISIDLLQFQNTSGVVRSGFDNGGNFYAASEGAVLIGTTGKRPYVNAYSLTVGNVQSHLEPAPSNTYRLGGPSAYWSAGYINQLHTQYIGWPGASIWSLQLSPENNVTVGGSLRQSQVWIGTTTPGVGDGYVLPQTAGIIYVSVSTAAWTFWLPTALSYGGGTLTIHWVDWEGLGGTRLIRPYPTNSGAVPRGQDTLNEWDWNADPQARMNYTAGSVAVLQSNGSNGWVTVYRRYGPPPLLP